MRIYDAACRLVAAGISVVPIRADGSKAPTTPWKQYQDRYPDDGELREWFLNKQRGIAAIGGPISGGLECLDFDEPGLFEEWLQDIEKAQPDLVERLVFVKTPSGGAHVWFRSSSCEANQVLAKRPSTPEELAGSPQAKWQKRIETRGTGGYAILPGSPSKCHPSGKTYIYHERGLVDLTFLKRISTEDRLILIESCRAFTTYCEEPENDRKHVRTNENLRSGTDYEQRGSWRELLAPHGWKLESGSWENGRLTRPGKKHGVGATIGYCKHAKTGSPLLHVFTTAAGIEAGTYSLFRAYTFLNHRGDYTLAAQALRQQGYGDNGHGSRANGQPPSLPPPVVDTTPQTQRWPAEPNALVYHGLAGEIVQTLAPHTEADPVALLVQLLLMFGNAVGRGPHCLIEASRHALNEFAVIVGDSATGRKGTSFNHIRQLFAYAAPAWAAERIQSGLSSGEGLIYHVRDAMPQTNDKKPPDEGVTDKRLLVVESEFANVLKVANRQTNTVSTILRQCWDGSTLGNMTKNNALKATNTHVSIIGHITTEELRKELNDVDVMNGFLNRFLFVCARRSNLLPFGGNPPTHALQRLRDSLKTAIEGAQRIGDLDFETNARDLWRASYESLTTAPPGAMGAIYNRAAPHVRRVAMLYATMAGSNIVNDEHLSAALALWQYCADSAGFIFGNSTGDRLADDIREYLTASMPYGMTRTEISNACGRHATASRISAALNILERSCFARRQEEETGGRRAERWFAVGGNP